MGVPAFFRWLSRKYPSIVVHCVEDSRRKLESGEDIPVDTSQPNPHGIEFDNLYLDMNGIIHPCTHPENKPAPKNEAEMFVAIFEYIDRIFSIVRPRKLLYMAIDGVAPRAKMNQQRSRRFRAGKESREKKAEIERLRSELLAKGAYLPEKKNAEHFDSNCITPGTPFMARLAVALRYYIHERLNTDPGWRGIEVILSDANVPGEGEHKIMDYIRRQRNQPDHDPNTKHCLCGADADLIMLGLATHEPYFTIIREEFKPNQPRPCDLCGQVGHEMKDCVGAAREEEQEQVVPVSGSSDGVDFIFIHLNVLREYLQKELKMEYLPFPYEFERALDDWVFMCFFVGNDFLPHLPSLEIRENAIDRLVGIYKQTVTRSGGWITDSGLVNMARVQLVLQDLGEVEDDIFNKRRSDDLRFKARQKREKRQRQSEGRWVQSSPAFAPTPLGAGRAAPGRVDKVQQVAAAERNLSNLESAAALKAMLRSDGGGGQGSGAGHKRSRSEPQGYPGAHGDDDSDDEPPDEVRLWEDGWKDRYYQSKFGVEAEDMQEFRVQVAHHYVRGLCWVLRYYYQGCRSWTWYFPYHYAPFASDFVNISDLSMDFLEGVTEPFKPLEQLMGVFPADSKAHVPETWQNLMTDPNSPIIDFYPTDFKIDLNGKKYLWMGVALLPFVDEKRLLAALDTVYPDITTEERERNVRGPDRIFCHMDHPLASLLMELYVGKDGKVTEEFAQKKVGEDAAKKAIVPQLAGGLAGKVWCDNRDLCFLPNETVRSPIALCEHLSNNKAVSACFADPEYDHQYIFPSKLLPSVTVPPNTLKPDDFPANRNYRPNLGYGVPQRNNANYNAGPMNRMVRGAMGRGSYQNHGGSGGGGGGHRSSSIPDLRQTGQYQQYGQQQYGQQQHGSQQQYGQQRYGQQQQQQPYYQVRHQSNFHHSNQGWQAGQQDPRQGGVYGQRQARGGYPMPPRSYQQGGQGGNRSYNDHNYYN